MEFSKDTIQIIDKIINQYPDGKQKSALLAVLHIAQAEFGGWLSVEVMDYVASLLKIQPIEVYEVATFYSMYNLKPVGKCVIEVCQTGPCRMNGAGQIIEYLEKKLGIKAGETTSDGKFTIKPVECLADCGNSPVLQIGRNYHGTMTKEKIDNLIEEMVKSDISSHQNPYK